MSSNYPPGVTGNEFAIAGPDYEKETDERCEKCGEIVFVLGYAGESLAGLRLLRLDGRCATRERA